MLTVLTTIYMYSTPHNICHELFFFHIREMLMQIAVWFPLILHRQKQLHTSPLIFLLQYLLIVHQLFLLIILVTTQSLLLLVTKRMRWDAIPSCVSHSEIVLQCVCVCVCVL